MIAANIKDNMARINVAIPANLTITRSRLASCTGLLFAGKVKFPRHGAEELISQLVGFGVERYDDAVDAFTLAVREFIAEYIEQIFVGVMWAD